MGKSQVDTNWSNSLDWLAASPHQSDVMSVTRMALPCSILLTCAWILIGTCRQLSQVHQTDHYFMPTMPSESNDYPTISRRSFILGSASIVGIALVSPVSALASIEPSGEGRTLAFRHTHTGERESLMYWRDGDYLADGLLQLDWLLRDHRTGESMSMDRTLLDLLYRLQQVVGVWGEFEIISAYRSPKTNRMLRSKSSGVAKRSLHMQGKAIDVRLPGCNLKKLRDAALSLKAGGIGYYPKSNFIHLDTGRFRYWS
jgi:uncharacterized protein YcbK (DUF882 family)